MGNKINSMTGYGKGIAEKDGIKLTIEIKSVNHRFLDVSMRFYRQFNFAENQIRDMVNKRITRGHLDVFLLYEDNREKKSKLVLDKDLLERYIELAKELKWKGCIDNFGNAEIISNPDIVKVEAIEDSEELLVELVNTACDKALEGLISMRAQEGKQLIEDILNKIDTLHAYIEEIRKRAPFVVSDYQERLTARISEMLHSQVVDEGRLAQEVAIYVDKSNIDEEITRLTAHIQHYKSLINQGGSIGKNLDFLTQEFLRETNTIGSKSSDIVITELVLKMKAIIEMIREQIQNIE